MTSSHNNETKKQKTNGEKDKKNFEARKIGK
jgi:hypothetical protein